MRFPKLALMVTSLAALLCASPAVADNFAVTNYQPNAAHFAAVDAGAYSNSTTTPTDVTSATITIPKTSRALTGNTTYGSSGVAQAIRVCFWADVTKATAGSGSVNVVVNGVTVTNASRTSAVIGRNSIGGCYITARPVSTSFVVKLQGVSSDTNAFTVNAAELTTEVLLFP